jgi:hypothetical protein
MDQFFIILFNLLNFLETFNNKKMLLVKNLLIFKNFFFFSIIKTFSKIFLII